MKFRSRIAAFAAATIIAVQAGLSAEADLTLKVVEKAAPEGVSDAIKAELQGTAIQLLDGDKPVYEFWLAKSIKLEKAPDAKDALAALAPITLLGVAQVEGDERDYRDDEIYTDVYTMRLAIQPSDGNHLGTSEFPYFAILIPAAKDTSVSGYDDADAMVDVGKEDTAAEHPIIMSLRPSDAEGPYPKLREPVYEHKTVVVEVPAKDADGAESKIVFEIVYEGLGEL